MEYTELTITLVPLIEDQREIIQAFLAEIGYESMVDTQLGLQAYIPTKDFSQTLLDFSFLPTETRIDYEYKAISQENWNKEWESNFKPVIISDKVIIKAPFHKDLPKAEYIIEIEPKMSFGTGHHETTSLMLEKLSTLNVKDMLVLDMGCGTGVLGIYASLRGAKHIDGIDIDEWAFENSRENTDRNHISNMEIIQGNADVIPEKQYDLILANINRNIILNDLSIYTEALKGKGQILLSGFYLNDMSKILAKAMDLNLRFEGYTLKNNWVMASFFKKF